MTGIVFNFSGSSACEAITHGALGCSYNRETPWITSSSLDVFVYATEKNTGVSVSLPNTRLQSCVVGSFGQDRAVRNVFCVSPSSLVICVDVFGGRSLSFECLDR